MCLNLNIINYEHNNQIVKSKSDFFDSSHFEKIMGLGIRNIDYSQLSEESLVYLFLHDEPSLTKKEVSEPNNSIFTIFLIFFVT